MTAPPSILSAISSATRSGRWWGQPRSSTRWALWSCWTRSGGRRRSEPGKSGFAPDSLRDAAEQAAAMPHVRIRGLMTIPPIQREPHGNLPFFAKVARLYVDIGRDLYDNKFDCLSMGMSDDFEDAIEAGATMVRVGSAIFGHRHYQ